MVFYKQEWLVMTKQQAINKIEDLEHDNKALWHYMQCLEKDIKQLKEKLNELPQHKQVDRS